MTAEQEQKLEESLRPVKEEKTDFLKIDFRKISAKYTCSAGSRQQMCTRYKEDRSGKCKYFSDLFCEAI